MICENCKKNSNNFLIHERHIFCSEECQEEYYKNKKKIKCRYCKEMFYEVDLIITQGRADTNILLSYDWGIPIWDREEIRKCPKCGRIYEIR